MLVSAVHAPHRLPGPLVLLSFLPAAGAHAASFPPHLRFRSVSTERVTVHYHQGLEPLARQAATVAEEILVRHEAHYGWKVGRVNLVVADVEDDPNGFATPLPYPLVNVRMAAPRGADDFGNYDDWLRLVLTHELAHIVHLDQAHGIIGFGRKVLGRAPYLFLNFTTPGWMIEGLATYEETEGPAFGRGRNPDTRMVKRMASLEGDFLREDEAALGLDRWPQGNAVYLFGEGFLRDLSQRYGPDVLPRLARVHSGRPLPYLDERTSRMVTGESFHAQWRIWRDESRREFDEEADAIRARGLTESTALTTLGIRQSGPRVSPDGEWIAYTRRTLTRFRAIHLMRRDGSGDRRLVLRNGGSGLGWTPDGSAARLRRARDLPDVQHALRPARGGPRQRTQPADHARPARARARRRPRRRDGRVRPPGRRPQRAGGRRTCPADPRAT